MEKIRVHAIVAHLESPTKWSIVGLYIPGMGHLPAVNSRREVIEAAWNMVDKEVKAKGAKIITLEEVDNGG